ncbi:MAG: hypothetical protein JSV78_09875 [Phycisphaerales bacterium]|nr:MAG: hypothetical protein JSV78_09875 [Phycisphaerales bacterium]
MSMPAGVGVWLVVAGIMTALGCAGREKAIGPVSIPNRTVGPMTVAVAPALNQSGSLDFDSSRFADLMARELSYAEGVKVVPVNRVLALLGAQGVGEVRSPEHAMELARLLGVDGLLVFVVTEYDPYEPPIIGITCQLYGTRPLAPLGGMDPVVLSRQARDYTPAGETRTRGLLAETQRFFDASHESVVDGVREFAEKRGAGGSPYGWRLYLVSQQHFMEYCCHATIRSLLSSDDSPAGECARREG